MDGEENVYAHNRIFGHKKNVVMSFEVKKNRIIEHSTGLDEPGTQRVLPPNSLSCVGT